MEKVLKMLVKSLQGGFRWTKLYYNSRSWPDKGPCETKDTHEFLKSKYYFHQKLQKSIGH